MPQDRSVDNIAGLSLQPPPTLARFPMDSAKVWRALPPEADRLSGAQRMRPTRFAVAVLSSLLGVACAHSAYGPSSDQRLEDSTTAKRSTEGADVASVKCTDLVPRLREAKSEEKPEGERLSVLIELFNSAKDRHTKLDEAVSRNPDLIYLAGGENTKANRDECRVFFADVRSDLDRFVREISDMPVIQEVQGNRTVGVARLDYALVRTALEALAPDDKDVLTARIDSAEKRVGSARPAKDPKPAKKGK
jgi:hypothetical protein